MKKLFTATAKLIDRIDDVRANSVTPEEFKETWGYSLKEHVDDMMDFVRKLERDFATGSAAKDVKERQQPTIVPSSGAKADTATTETTGKSESNNLFRNDDTKNSPATTAINQDDTKMEMTIDVDDAESINMLADSILEQIEKILSENILSEKIHDMLKKIVVTKGNKAKRKGSKVTQHSLQKKIEPTSWVLKLVAVNTGSEKSIEEGEPVEIRSIDNPGDDHTLVARVLNTDRRKSGCIPKATPFGGVKVTKPTKGANILFSDLGRLDVG